jgi:hypothetical protein
MTFAPLKKMARIKIMYWDEEVKFNGVLLKDLLFDDIFDIIEEEGGPVSASDLASSLRAGRWCQHNSQLNKNHKWVISKGEYIERIAKDLGFTIGPCKHRKTGKDLQGTYSIFV